jgi:hypothetical protein
MTSQPPPSAVPWIAATTGFDDASIMSTTVGRPGSTISLPNSVMSAPAKNVRPSQRITIAVMLSSFTPSLIAASRPWRTAAPSALTGGLFEVMTSTSSWRSERIGEVIQSPEFLSFNAV